MQNKNVDKNDPHRCYICGFRKRGRNHNAGTHHQDELRKRAESFRLQGLDWPDDDAHRIL